MEDKEVSKDIVVISFWNSALSIPLVNVEGWLHTGFMLVKISLEYSSPVCLSIAHGCFHSKLTETI